MKSPCFACGKITEFCVECEFIEELALETEELEREAIENGWWEQWEEEEF